MRDIGATYPVSDLADPPIGIHDTQRADTAVCRMHYGRISQNLAAGDDYGNVYFCPVGQMYWRLSKQVSGMYAPLNFPRGL